MTQKLQFSSLPRTDGGYFVIYSGKGFYATLMKCTEATKAKMQEHMTCLSKEKETLPCFYLFTKTHSRFSHIIYQKQTGTCNSHVVPNTPPAFLLFEFSLFTQGLWCRHRNLSEIKNAKYNHFVIKLFWRLQRKLQCFTERKKKKKSVFLYKYSNWLMRIRTIQELSFRGFLLKQLLLMPQSL